MEPIAPPLEHREEGASPRRPPRRRCVLAAAGLALVLAGSLAACGADTGGNDVASLATGDQAGGTSTTVATPLTEEEIAEAQQAFQACMEEHGVDIQVAPVEADGSGGGGMVLRTEGGGPADEGSADMPSKDEMDAANEACQPLMDKVIQNAPKPDPEEMAQMKEQALQFAQCMRDNGVDMPDPQFEENGGMTQSLGEEQGKDPDMESATETCKEYMLGPDGEMPTLGAGPAGGASSGGPSAGIATTGGGE
jgi:hypothetical protein